MNSSSDPLEWVNRAEEDYQLSRLSLRRKIPMTYGATFHSQQSAEKYLKALLTLRRIDFPRTHDLAALYVLCQQNGMIIPVSEDDFDKLSAFAVEVRYPGMQPTVDEAKEALEIAKNVRRYARKFLGL
jgi:HEPN domain-containing protein